MADEFQAYLIGKDDGGQRCALTTLGDADLMEGDVTVAVEYTTINYKDGLALTGRSPIIRKFPLIPGIDFCGRVIDSEHADFKAGDAVILNGWGVGESHHGGYAQRARVSGDWLVPLPEGMTARDAMAIGTAGYTAMLSVLALEDHGVTAGDGEVLVTGAAGGVGSIGVAVLAKLGYHVVASTGRPQEQAFLERLGASEIVDRANFSEPARPLDRERWAGAIDVAGGNTLANVLSQIRRAGAAAVCGLAESMNLPTTVAPFILRGVAMYGIDSVMAPTERRKLAWQRLQADLDKELLAELSFDLDFAELPQAAEDILDGKIRGRAVVKLPD